MLYESIMNLFDQFGSPTTLIFMVMVLVVSFILLMRTSRYFSRPRQDEPTWSHGSHQRPGGSSITSTATAMKHKDTIPEMDRWEVEMHETARELMARLDSKMRALQALIAEADRAAARLEAASNNGTNAPADSTRQGGSVLFNAQSGSLTNEETKWTGLPSNQAEALRPAATANASGASVQYRQNEIYALSDSGLSDTAISQRLGMPIGEVELILSLREKRTS